MTSAVIYRVWYNHSSVFFAFEILVTTASKVSVFGVIQSECGETRTIITPNMDTFYAVHVIWILMGDIHFAKLHLMKLM